MQLLFYRNFIETTGRRLRLQARFIFDGLALRVLRDVQFFDISISVA